MATKHDKTAQRIADKEGTSYNKREFDNKISKYRRRLG